MIALRSILVQCGGHGSKVCFNLRNGWPRRPLFRHRRWCRFGAVAYPSISHALSVALASPRLVGSIRALQFSRRLASADTETANVELIDACLIGDLKAAKKAISSGANVNHQDYAAESSRRNPITAAIHGGNSELVSVLILPLIPSVPMKLIRAMEKQWPS